MLSLALASALFVAAAPVAVVPRHIEPVCGARDASGFGYRVDPFTGRNSFHGGLDFSIEIGHPVFASAAGRVVAARWRGPYGLMVEIEHSRTHRTRYGHLAGIAVEHGQLVAQGATIGWSGSTGRTVSPTVHFEVWQDDSVKDPKKYLRPNPRCASR
jgi:murein DD-endopeptidase MepM/ murein hydrolase activator NlpD